MRSLFVASILSFFILGGGIFDAEARVKAMEFYDAPIQVEGAGFYNEAGERVSLSDYNDKPVMLNIWATWCGTCVKEMPDMMALHKANADEYHFLALSIDKKGFETLTPFVEKKGWQDLALFHDKGKTMFSALKVRGTPTTFMLNKEGAITAMIQGDPKWDAEILEKLLASAK